MAVKIDGKAIAAAVRQEVRAEVEEMAKNGLAPGLEVIVVGDDPASRVYVNNKKKACAEAGMRSEEFALPADATQEELLALVEELNARTDIHGICANYPCRVIWMTKR